MAYVNDFKVATVLTACGIETMEDAARASITNETVATVLTACGIETYTDKDSSIRFNKVATVLTACGIETPLRQTSFEPNRCCNSAYRLRY